MKVSIQVKEKIGRTISNYFVTNKIVDIFTSSNIPADKSLSAKWRIVVDGFNKISDEKDFFYILNAFCHPLNFEDSEKRLAFINELQPALAYEDIGIEINKKDVLFIKRKTDNENYVHYEKPEKQKTSIDYIIEAVNFFKEEYNKVKILGLTYEYCIGELYGTGNNVEYSTDYQKSLEAINHLKEAGIIREYKTAVIDNENGTWATVKCKINENKLMQKEAPQATVEAELLAQKIIHEHTHHFDNSIQEKEINLTHKIIEDEKANSVNGKKIPKETAIVLNQFGDLYKEPKNKFCYSMGETNDRHRIVRQLIANKGYKQTSQIALIFDNKSEESIISEIGKINSMSKGKLSVKDNIILGKKGSGYRANPVFKFILKNE